VFVVSLSGSPEFCNCSIWQTFWQLSIYGQAKPVTVAQLDIKKWEFIINGWNKGRKWGGGTAGEWCYHLGQQNVYFKLKKKKFTALEKFSTTESNKKEIQ